jgi:hypothetical protein
MEDSFVSLLYRLGYTVYVKCDQKTGLDVIAKFYGEPIDPKPLYPCNLLPPLFAPSGIIAFSLKRGAFSKSDVDELITKVKEARNLEDPLLNSIEGMVIATNFSLKENDVDTLLLQKIYCWDGRRLIFYSAKAQTIQNLASRGSVSEVLIGDLDKTSYLIEIETSEKVKNSLSANVAVFIDDHSKELTIGSHHVEKILIFIWEKSLKQIAESTRFDIQVFLKIHALGIANEIVVKNAYKKYAMDVTLHPKVFFPAEPIVFQYGAAPWSILFS